MLTKRASQPSNESHPTLADGAASAEAQALAENAGPAAGAQTAQVPKTIAGDVCIVCGRAHSDLYDLYVRALVKIGKPYAAGDLAQLEKLLRALLVERQASLTCRKCRGSGTISVKHGMIFDTDSKDEIADAFHKETCGCRKAADAALRKFVEGTNLPDQRAERTEEHRTRQQSREAKLSETS